MIYTFYTARKYKSAGLLVARRCEASGEAGMHRSEAEGRFGEAEPEGRASVCAEPLCKPIVLSCGSFQIAFPWRLAMANEMPRLLGDLLVFEVRVVGRGIESTCNANTCDTTFVTAERNIIDN